MSFFSSRSPHTRWPRDWSSDVCCSDLSPTHVDVVAVGVGDPLDNGAEGDRGQLGDAEGVHVGAQRDRSQGRSEERRVGQECRSDVWLSHSYKNVKPCWNYVELIV